MIETERKFLVTNDGWKKASAKKIKIRQGYLAKSKGITVRVRIANEKAFITVKGKRVNLSCPEYEYEIPLVDAEEMITMSVTLLIEKTRYLVFVNGIKWEIDVFKGVNAGLVMAEVEFDEGVAPTLGQLPTWVGTEVSYDKRYTNVYIAEHVVPHSL
jgi:adenylate cyclase